MASDWLCILVLAATFISTYIYAFISNIIAVRRSGLPLIAVPVPPNSVLWMLIATPLRPWLAKKLPDFIYRRVVVCIYGWEYHEKLRPYKTFAAPQGNLKSFMLATCQRAELWTWDSEMAAQILSRPQDFNQLDTANLIVSS